MTTGALKSAYNALLNKGRLSPNPGQAALIARLTDLQTTLATSPRQAPNGLYIYGSVGTGKSRIADLFAATLPPHISRRRAHFHEFMLDVHSRLHRAWSSGGGGGVDPLAHIGRDIVRTESRVLCFDEFQVTDIADAMILQRLFTAIWDAGGVLVATSNRHPDALYENGLNRALFLPFIALLQRRCELWRMAGDEDYRRIGAAGADRVRTFFSAAEEDPAAAAAAFAAALDRECRGAVLAPRELRVMMGRHLRVRAADPGGPLANRSGSGGGLVVHSSFTELCEANLGAADYHALCGAAAAIFIDGVRPLGRSELDYARRLITLVDVAYEARTRVFLLCCEEGAETLEGLFRDIVVAERERVMSSSSGERRLTTMDVRRGGGASSSMMSTFVGGDTEWSATGLAAASLAAGGAGETDVVFAVGRAVSRLFEMGSAGYGAKD